MRWLKLNPAGRVNITDQDAFNQVTDVAKYANGRLVPNDRTRVHRDWKLDSITWSGKQPSTYTDFTRFEGLFPLDIANGIEGETPSQLGYIGALIRLDEGGAGDATVFNVIRPNGDGTWTLGNEGDAVPLRWWDDEGAVTKLEGPNSWDYTKSGAWVLIGSIGDPFAVIPNAAGDDVYAHHLLARMRPPQEDSLTLNEEMYIPYRRHSGVLYWREGIVGHTGVPAEMDIIFVTGDPFNSGAPEDARPIPCAWDISGFAYTEIVELDGEWYESEPRKLGWTAGPHQFGWFYIRETNTQAVYDSHGFESSGQYADWSPFQETSFNYRTIWPSEDSVFAEFTVNEDGYSSYNWHYNFFQDTAATGPQNWGSSSPTVKYRMYYQNLGIAQNSKLMKIMANDLELDADFPRYFWTKAGSYFGTWDGSGNYIPEPWITGISDTYDNTVIGYNPEDPAVILAESWIEDKAPLIANSFAEFTAQQTPLTDQHEWYDPVYDRTLYEDETFAIDKVEYGDGKGVVRYDKAISPSRYVIVEQFRGHTLSVPIDNRSVIEFSPPDEPYYRPEPFKLYIQTEGDDEIVAIKAYQNMAIIFTKSHVMKLNYLPVEGVFQDKEMIEIMSRGRVLTERKALATVSFNNSHYISWMSRDGLNITDGNIIYNVCPDFSLHALNFVLTNDADNRMSLINNVDDYRLELWLHDESTGERWDFYYHDSHLIQQRFMKLRGPTVISDGVQGISYIPDLPGSSRRTGRVFYINGSGDISLQTDDYTDDNLQWNADRIWGADPLDLVRYDGIMLEIPGTSGHDYYSHNYSSNTEAEEARLERNQLDVFAGPKLCKGSLEDSSGEWVQPGFEVEHNIIGDTWVGTVWLKINSKDRAN